MEGGVRDDLPLPLLPDGRDALGGDSLEEEDGFDPG